MIHFYCFHNNFKIIISDLAVKEIRQRYGYRYELVNSVKDKDSVDIIKQKLLKFYPNFVFVEHYKRKIIFTEEVRKKIRDSKIGGKHSEETKRKISAARKGKGNFAGKNHSYESKQLIAEAKLGNDHAKDLQWFHDSRGDKEIRIKNYKYAPVGFTKGRDYYSMEELIFARKSKRLVR